MSSSRINVYGMTFACALYHIIIRPSISLPLYSNTHPKTYSFVVCTDLDNAVTALREASLNQHTVGADWLETNCITIDPCQHTNSFGESVPKDTWLHGNTSKLTLTNSLVNVVAAESGTEAESCRCTVSSRTRAPHPMPLAARPPR